MGFITLHEYFNRLNEKKYSSDDGSVFTSIWNWFKKVKAKAKLRSGAKKIISANDKYWSEYVNVEHLRDKKTAESDRDKKDTMRRRVDAQDERLKAYKSKISTQWNSYKNKLSNAVEGMDDYIAQYNAIVNYKDALSKEKAYKAAEESKTMLKDAHEQIQKYKKHVAETEAEIKKSDEEAAEKLKNDKKKVLPKEELDRQEKAKEDIANEKDEEKRLELEKKNQQLEEEALKKAQKEYEEQHGKIRGHEDNGKNATLEPKGKVTGGGSRDSKKEDEPVNKDKSSQETEKETDDDSSKKKEILDSKIKEMQDKIEKDKEDIENMNVTADKEKAEKYIEKLNNELSKLKDERESLGECYDFELDLLELELENFNTCYEFNKNLILEYKLQHSAPLKDEQNLITNLDHLFPDIYTRNGADYFGHHSSDYSDKKTVNLIQSLKGKPNENVMIYRAVPKDSNINSINDGDWITINKEYAIVHGVKFDAYKILSKKVKAKEIYSDGNDIYEYSYYSK